MSKTTSTFKTKVRYKDQFDGLKYGFVLNPTDKFSITDSQKIKSDVRKSGSKLFMTIKRYFHKRFIGERKNGIKTEFKTSLFVLQIDENKFNPKVISIVRKNGFEIAGVIINNKFERDYSLYTKYGFNSGYLTLFMLLSLLKLLTVIKMLKN